MEQNHICKDISTFDCNQKLSSCQLSVECWLSGRKKKNGSTLGHTSACGGTRRRFWSALLRAGWGTHTNAAALTAGAGAAGETQKTDTIRPWRIGFLGHTASEWVQETGSVRATGRVRYLCSLRLWRCCLMRASILAATSLHSLVRDSSWGVFRPLSSCGVSEHEKDLSRPLWARHTAAYCTMFSSGGQRRETRRSGNSQQGRSPLQCWGVLQSWCRDWPETRLWLSWREFISLLNLCWAEQRLHRYLAVFDLSVMKVYFFLPPRLSTTNLRLCRNAKKNHKCPCQAHIYFGSNVYLQYRKREWNEGGITPLTLEEMVAVSLQ